MDKNGSNSTDNTNGTMFFSPYFLKLLMVLTLVWSFVFVLAFAVCLLILKIKNSKKEKQLDESRKSHEYEDLNLCTSQNEVYGKITNKEKHKSYKEKTNSVYYEWFLRSSPEENSTIHSSDVHENQQL